MTTTALITGASSGIGRDLAREHARRGGRLILVARRGDRLETLAAELVDRHGIAVTVLPCDLAAPGAAAALHQEVAGRGLVVDQLINNAGFGGLGRFHEMDPQRQDAMVQLNVMALTQLTRAYLPEMIARGRGRVLNVASTAAFMPGPTQAVYFATKAYVLSFTEAVAVELEGTGVTMTALCPGATVTEFADQAAAGNKRMFRAGAATSAEVAAFGYRAMLAGRTVAIHRARSSPGAWAIPPAPRPGREQDIGPAIAQIGHGHGLHPPVFGQLAGGVAPAAAEYLGHNITPSAIGGEGVAVRASPALVQAQPVQTLHGPAGVPLRRLLRDGQGDLTRLPATGSKKEQTLGEGSQTPKSRTQVQAARLLCLGCISQALPLG